MFLNSMPRYEILSSDALATLDSGWRKIVTEIGVQFAKPEAVALFEPLDAADEGLLAVGPPPRAEWPALPTAAACAATANALATWRDAAS